MLCKMFKLLALISLVLCTASMFVSVAQAASTNTAEPAPVQIIRRVPLPLSRKPASKQVPAGAGEFIDRVFVERKTHRVLVQVRHSPKQQSEQLPDPDKFYWIKQEVVSRCLDWPYTTTGSSSDMRLLAADLNAGLLYYIAWNGGFLHVINRKGADGVSPELPGRMFCLAIGTKPGHAYWGFDDYNVDVSFGGWIGVYGDGPRMERRNVGETPSQLLYSTAEDDAVMLRGEGWQLLNGKAHPYPQVTPFSAAPIPADRWKDLYFSMGASDLDATGEYLYYVDCFGYTLYKIRVKDGVTLEARKLPFVVSALAIDSDSGLIHLVDWRNDRVVTVKSF